MQKLLLANIAFIAWCCWCCKSLFYFNMKSLFFIFLYFIWKN